MRPVDKVKKKPQKIVSTHWWAKNLIIVRMRKDKIHIKKRGKKKEELDRHIPIKNLLQSYSNQHSVVLT